MRLVGKLSTAEQAHILADYLLTLEIPCQVREGQEEYGLWTLEEDLLYDAKHELAQFLEDPNATKYQDCVAAASKIRAQAEKSKQKRQALQRHLPSAWRQPELLDLPVTIGLVLICTAISLVTGFGSASQGSLVQALTHSTVELIQQKKIIGNEYWRLITPIFLHFGPLHIVMNMVGLFFLGTLVEGRKGSLTYILIVFLTGLAGNLVQMSWMEQEGILNVIFRDGEIAKFGGMSGAIYGIIGYVWVKEKYYPSEGLFLPSSIYRFSMFWFVLCFFMDSVANGAHFGGLVSGLTLAATGPRLAQIIRRK